MDYAQFLFPGLPAEPKPFQEEDHAAEAEAADIKHLMHHGVIASADKAQTGQGEFIFHDENGKLPLGFETEDDN